MIGLKPKASGATPIAVTPDEVLANFQTSSDQPIYVAYTLMKDLQTEAIAWHKDASPTAPSSPKDGISASQKSNEDTTLTADKVLNKINSVYMFGPKRCYKEYLAKDPKAQGKLGLEFTVSETGRVSKARATGVAAELDACVSNAMDSWTFPRPLDNAGNPTTAVFIITLNLVPE